MFIFVADRQPGQISLAKFKQPQCLRICALHKICITAVFCIFFLYSLYMMYKNLNVTKLLCKSVPVPLLPYKTSIPKFIILLACLQTLTNFPTHNRLALEIRWHILLYLFFRKTDGDTWIRDCYSHDNQICYNWYIPHCDPLLHRALPYYIEVGLCIYSALISGYGFKC